MGSITIYHVSLKFSFGIVILVDYRNMLGTDIHQYYLNVDAIFYVDAMLCINVLWNIWGIREKYEWNYYAILCINSWLNSFIVGCQLAYMALVLFTQLIFEH